MISASIFELIQSVLLIVVAIITIIISIGILRLDSDMDNVVYARIHILGVIDIASVIAFICLGDPLLGVLYFILAPFTAHAMAHGYFHGEDLKNNPYASDSEELLEISDRVYVFYEGRVSDMLVGPTKTPERLVAAMMGMHTQKEEKAV